MTPKTSDTPHEIEAPSGKMAKDENFPVGSFLIARHLRPAVAAYYDFARAGDDIGDDQHLTEDEKITRLTAFEDALLHPTKAPAGAQKATALAHALEARNISTERGRKLLDAFRQDATKNRYDTWDDLIDYCTKSADPVGRFLLDLHNEDPSGYPQSDALCTVLQILNHLQDCGKDREELDRVYIPLNLLEKHNLDVSVLDGAFAPPAFRAVLDECLEGCKPLLASARTLPAHLKDRRLAAESTVIITLAHRLSERLAKQDPLAGRVALSKLDFALAALRGIWCLMTHRKPSK